jgi:hypothetical protein
MRLARCVLLAGHVLFGFCTGAFAGDLEPPGPPTTGTMHTLEEIYNIAVDINSKVSGGTGLPYTAPVEASGQTNSFQTGDDGHLRRGVAWPNPRFTDNGDATVTDNLTGLMWTKNADIGNGTRQWSQGIMDCEACIVGGYVDWHLPNIKELFSVTHFGYFDPAVPNTAGTGKCTENDPFINMSMTEYWSSTTYCNPTLTTAAWCVILFSGILEGMNKETYCFVWCVRGGPN